MFSFVSFLSVFWNMAWACIFVWIGTGENDVVTLQQRTRGFFGRLRLPLNDVRSGECGAGHGGNAGAKTQKLCHSEGEARGIPDAGAEWYVVVTMAQPTVGILRSRCSL